jgi:hypothetical protein
MDYEGWLESDVIVDLARRVDELEETVREMTK